MLQIIPYTQSIQWNQIVHSFFNFDVYYLNEYALSIMIHEGGEPFLIYYEDETCRVCYVMMKNDIAEAGAFSSFLPPKTFFDSQTPYGYGGPLVEGIYTETTERHFFLQLQSYCKKEGIVSQFLRFHPLYQNQKYFESVCDMQNIKDTIFMDISSPETIWKNMDTKNRNMIRKARKNGVSISYDQGVFLDEFLDIYYQTMTKRQALDYYYFGREYFEYLIQNFSDNTIFFYSHFEGKIIGASIFLFCDNFLHYHLSGTLSAYRHTASTNLLLYEAAEWGYRQGIKAFHLGGGVDAGDSLFKFKKQFHKTGQLPFYIGRIIFDDQKYKHLLRLRKQHDPTFDTNNTRLIQYRK